jgi:hypothetical protein
MGGYFKSKGENPNNKIINRIYNVHYPLEMGNNVAYSQMKYLECIIKLCKENNIELMLVSTPVHSNYKDKVNEIYFNVLSKVIKQSNCAYVNFLDENTPVNYLSDANHLNVKGAIVYSKKINDIIN